MTSKRITETMHIDQLPQALAGRKNVQRAHTEAQEKKMTQDTDLSQIASKLAANAIMSEEAIVIELPLPPSSLSPNVKVHWAVKRRCVQEYRTVARLAAMQQHSKVFFREANYFFVFKRSRKADRDNLIASMKAGLDGLQDARIVANDSNLHPMGCEQFTGQKYQPYGVRIILWERK